MTLEVTLSFICTCLTLRALQRTVCRIRHHCCMTVFCLGLLFHDSNKCMHVILLSVQCLNGSGVLSQWDIRAFNNYGDMRQQPSNAHIVSAKFLRRRTATVSGAVV